MVAGEAWEAEVQTKQAQQPPASMQAVVSARATLCPGAPWGADTLTAAGGIVFHKAQTSILLTFHRCEAVWGKVVPIGSCGNQALQQILKICEKLALGLKSFGIVYRCHKLSK